MPIEHYLTIITKLGVYQFVLMNYVQELINSIINIINESNEFPHVSYGTVNSIKHNLGVNYLPPHQMFPISDSQRLNCLKFSQHHINAHVEWTKF